MKSSLSPCSFENLHLSHSQKHQKKTSPTHATDRPPKQRPTQLIPFNLPVVIQVVVVPVAVEDGVEQDVNAPPFKGFGFSFG